MTRFFFANECGYDPWDFRTPDATGIGASEVAQCVLTRTLAARDHKVTSFAPTPDEQSACDRDVCWHHHGKIDSNLEEPGIWVVSRSPGLLDKLPPMPGRQVWFVCQDVEYGDALTPERMARIDRCLALCPMHKEYLESRYPALKDRIYLSSNGVRVDLVEQVEKEPVERNPFRILHTSSPDRGLVPLLAIFKRAREFEPRLELVVAYGFDNLLKSVKGRQRENVEKLQAQLDAPGITHHGRLPQPDLYRLAMTCGLYCYPTDFTETSCAAHQEAMALGCVPVFSPLWALEYNGGHGIAIAGDANEPITRARFVRAILHLAWVPQLQEQIRAEMVPWAKRQFDWERVADHYEAMAYAGQ